MSSRIFYWSSSCDLCGLKRETKDYWRDGPDPSAAADRCEAEMRLVWSEMIQHYREVHGVTMTVADYERTLAEVGKGTP